MKSAVLRVIQHNNEFEYMLEVFSIFNILAVQMFPFNWWIYRHEIPLSRLGTYSFIEHSGNAISDYLGGL